MRDRVILDAGPLVAFTNRPGRTSVQAGMSPLPVQDSTTGGTGPGRLGPDRTLTI